MMLSSTRSTARLIGVLVAAVVLTACGGGGGTTDDPTPSATTTVAPTPLEEWAAARAFLDKQTKPPEIVCQYLKTKKPAEFFSFDADDEQWRSDLLFRTDPARKDADRACSANVPTSVDYSVAGINGFLKPLGFYFDDEAKADGLKQVEIAYAGSTPDDPDIAYAKTPGLWGAALTLGSIGVERKGGIPTPTDDAEAQKFLDQTVPLLTWYGYNPPS